MLSITPTGAGARLIPQSIGASIGSLGSGLLMRATGRYWYLNFLMQLVSLVATSLIAGTFDARMGHSLADTVPPFIYLFMVGCAYGSMLTITLLSLIAAVDHKHQAVITSASYAFRSTGSTIGITLGSVVFQNLLRDGLYARFGNENEDQIKRIRDSVDEVKRLPPEWHTGVIEAYVDALRGVWVVVLGLAALAAISSLFLREHILHKNLERR